MKDVTFVIPSHNNLKHLKNVYNSIKRHEPESYIVLLDDGSNDDTYDWITSLIDDKLITYRSDNRVGHTILYDVGISLAKTEIVGILHADMIIGPNYVKNMTKWLVPGTVVCATRIEPPLHPAGKEKLIMNFGIDFDSLDTVAFDDECIKLQDENKDITTRGMFAPWMIYKSDFESIGGHDKLFAPFPYEDSDIFQRWILNGFSLIQTRDAFVYHLTCRGHRWTETIGVDDEHFKFVSWKGSRNWLRKWGTWIQNDEYQYPIITPKYKITLVVNNASIDIIEMLEPICSTLVTDNQYNIYSYVLANQQYTDYDLSGRVVNSIPPDNDILIEFDASKLTNESINILYNIQKIISETDEIGEFELDIFNVKINRLIDRTRELIKL